jgi:hypothetical protein
MMSRDGVLFWMLPACHLRRDPQPNALPDQAQPYGDVLLLWAIEAIHGLAKATRVDEKCWGSGNRVMLQRFVLV